MDFRIGHLAYRTRDMEKTLAFYTGALGFQHIFSLANERGEKWIEYVMTPDGRFLEFFYPDETPVEPGTGYMHLCLEVDDCASAVAELEAKGVAIRVAPNVGSDGNVQAWIRDPDGRDIELMQLSPDSEQARNRAKL